MGRLVAIVLVAIAASLAVDAAGTGCQKKLTKICPQWADSKAECEECIKDDFNKLKSDCTEKQLEKKCDSVTPSPPPTPPPPGPPTPPLPPRPGAPRPHIVLFVVDDMGWANTEFHNEFHTKTPAMRELAQNGIVLDRHYTFRWCAPTRSALMTGRLPYHVLQQTNFVTRGMTMIPAKLKQVGYKTHQVGKWHLGNLEPWMTPVGRGFDTSLGYLSGGEDHYTQLQHGSFGCDGTDLYNSTQPAYGQSGRYSSYIYNDHLKKLVDAHNPSDPLFLYVALQAMHAPQEVPSFYSDMFSNYSSDYAIMNGMGTIADSVLANLTQFLKEKDMYKDTLIVLTSDNGGPAGEASSGHSGNNYPLRGGKVTDWEGGVRVSSCVGGGFLPQSARGIVREGYLHACDWYPTFAGLAGVPANDTYPGVDVPPVDGRDMWPYLSGNVSQSPRTEMVLSLEEDTAAIISGDYKLIIGLQPYGFWQGPVYPNATTNHSAETTFDCGASGCLFNVQDDPGEHVDLAKTMPDKLAELHKLIQLRNQTTFNQPRVKMNTTACKEYLKAHNGFLGPYYTGNTDVTGDTSSAALKDD